MFTENPLRNKIVDAIRKERMLQEQKSKTPQDVVLESYLEQLRKKATQIRVELLERHLFFRSDFTFQDFFMVILQESQQTVTKQGEDTQLITDLEILRDKTSTEDQAEIADLKVNFLTSIIQFLRIYLSNQSKNEGTAYQIKNEIRDTIQGILDQQSDRVRTNTAETLSRIESRDEPLPISGWFLSIGDQVTELRVFLDALNTQAGKLSHLLKNNLRTNPVAALNYIDSSIAEIEKRGLEASLEVLAMQRNYVVEVLENTRKITQDSVEPSSESPDQSSQNSLHDQEKS